jgi:hypothetical protein
MYIIVLCFMRALYNWFLLVPLMTLPRTPPQFTLRHVFSLYHVAGVRKRVLGGATVVLNA